VVARGKLRQPGCHWDMCCAVHPGCPPHNLWQAGAEQLLWHTLAAALTAPPLMAGAE